MQVWEWTNAILELIETYDYCRKIYSQFVLRIILKVIADISAKNNEKLSYNDDQTHMDQCYVI